MQTLWAIALFSTIFSADVFACAKAFNRKPAKPTPLSVDAALVNATAAVHINGRMDWSHASTLTLLRSPNGSGLTAGETILVVYPTRSQALYRFGNEGATYFGLKLLPISFSSKKIEIDPLFGSDVPPSHVFLLTGRVPKKEEDKARERKAMHLGKVLAAVATRADFDTLEPKHQAEVIKGYTEAQVTVKEDLPLNKIRAQGDRDFAKKMKEQVEREVDLNPETNGVYAVVGKPQFTFTITRDRDGKLLGGRVSVFVNGVSYEGDRSWFRTMADAERAGGDDNDVSWSLTITFDHRLNQLEGENYLEWSGH